MYFYGKFEFAIDAKGRLSIPSRFREALAAQREERLMVTKFIKDRARCLDAYPPSAWSRLESQLRARRRFDPRMIAFETFYIAGAHECPIDRHGRILLPPDLRQYAGLKREVVLTGYIEKFRIWDKAVWDKVFSESERSFAEHPELFADLEL